ELVAGRELLQPGEDAGLALLPVREKAVDVADDDSGPGLAGLPLVAVLELLLPRVPAGLLGGEHRGDFEAVAVGAVLRLAGEAERDQRGADVQLRQVDGCGVRLLGVDHRDGAGRGGRVGERVRVVLGAAPREKECGTEHQGGESHAGPTPVETPPDGTVTFSTLTTSSLSSKSLLESAAVSWPGSQAMRSSSASRPCGSPGIAFRTSCAVRPSARGKSLQSRSTAGSAGSLTSGSSEGSCVSLVGGVEVGGASPPQSRSKSALASSSAFFSSSASVWLALRFRALASVLSASTRAASSSPRRTRRRALAESM